MEFCGAITALPAADHPPAKVHWSPWASETVRETFTLSLSGAPAAFAKGRKVLVGLLGEFLLYVACHVIEERPHAAGHEAPFAKAEVNFS